MVSEEQQRIIDRFMERVYGKVADTTSANPKHEGRGGHWLEVQMQVTHNARNAPDIQGFEMKNDTMSKTSFGDWSASYYIYKDEKVFPNLQGKRGKEKMNQIRKNKSVFIKTFGRPVNGRYSWSGEPCPKRVTDGVNDFGQKIVIEDDNSISVKYYFSKDQRKDKSEIVPEEFQAEGLTIVRWDKEWMRGKVEKKFNQKGWFKCLTDKSGVYNSIVFGSPFTFEKFIDLVKNGDVIFDSGMVDGKSRLYSMWRASNSFWNSLVDSRHP